MSYRDLLQGLETNNLLQVSTQENVKSESVNIPEISHDVNQIKLFNVPEFIKDIKSHSAQFNKKYLDNSDTISAYDIAHNCIRIPIFKLRNTPVEKYENNWLPVAFRIELGHSAHNFIENISKVLTETELTLKVPSLKVSARLDCVINDNVLIEVKSVPYKDYEKLTRQNKPRDGDFLQAVLYKYLLENHLDEIKLQQPSHGGSLPKLDKYKIEYIQLVYICHELIAGDSTSITEEMKIATALKKSVNSKYNQFWFIKPIDINMKSIDIDTYENHIKEKIALINESMSNNRIPNMDNKFVDTKSCFFCLFSKSCKQIP